MNKIRINFPLIISILFTQIFFQSCLQIDSPVNDPAVIVSNQQPDNSTLLSPPLPFNIKIAWFYKPPASDSMSLVAKKFNFFILTKGDEIERDQLLKLGISRPILQYLRFDAINDPGSCSEQPRNNQVAFNPGDFCMIEKDHPDWFLLNTNGQRIYRTKDDHSYVFMDPGNPGWRAFFLNRIHETFRQDLKWDGVFLDNVEVTLSRREDRNEIPYNYPDETSYQTATQGFLQYLYANFFQPYRKLLYANITARRDEADFTSYITYLDGAMHEGWAIDWPNGYRSADIWEKQMELAENTQKMGKFIILVSHGDLNNLDLEQFSFASYLLINQGAAAFRYSNSYNDVWLYDNYSIDLGSPLESRYLKGKVWRRDFTNGYVEVNPESHEVNIIKNSK